MKRFSNFFEITTNSSINRPKYECRVNNVLESALGTAIGGALKVYQSKIAANIPVNPAQPGGLAFLRTALKPVHLTGRAGVGGDWPQRVVADGFFMARQQRQDVKKSRVSGSDRCRHCHNNMAEGRAYPQRPARLSTSCSFW